MTGEARALIDSLDERGVDHLLGWLAAALDAGQDFTADDLVRAVAASRDEAS